MSQFKNLVFEGGGVKGIAYAGAIKVLEERGMLKDVRRVAGTSAGAITATLLALGADSKDVKDIVSGTNFRDFMDDSWGVIRDSRRLVNEFGWFKGDAFGQWMKKQINAMCGKPDLTFKQLESLAAGNPDHFNQLHIVCTNLTLQLAQPYSADDAPDMPIWQAVRRSMSIPLFFASVRENGEIFVDGGVTWNYPVDIYDDMEFLSENEEAHFDVPDYPTRYNGKHVYNKQTLGFRVDTRDEIAAEKAAMRLPPLQIEGFADYARALIGFMTEMANKAHLHENDWHRTVYIDAAGVRATDFKLAEKQVATLLENGEDDTRKFFTWFENPESTPLNRVADPRVSDW